MLAGIACVLTGVFAVLGDEIKLLAVCFVIIKL
jgi:hypothetical protein